MNLQLGPMHAASFASDPKHLGFVLARYKFVAKMLAGNESVLEVGCGDCTGAELVIPVVKDWRGLDIDDRVPNMGYRVQAHDILDGPLLRFYDDERATFDAVYALDVLEHIDPANEDLAMQHICMMLKPHGVCIIGMPSLESQAYASAESVKHHVNCKTEDELRHTMSDKFHNVFIFGMNDETLHTGFGPMCHYRLAIGVGKR